MGDGGRLWATDELAALLSELAESLDQLDKGCVVMTADGDQVDHRTPPLYEVFRLVAASRSDGFPRRSGVNEGGPASVLDDLGFPMPPRSDPTGELAVADAESRSSDPIRKHAQNALRALVDARNLLRKAKSETILAFHETDVSATSGDPRCRVHALVDVFEDVFRGDRCRFCYDFWRSEQADPDTELLSIQVDRRVNTRDVEAWAERQRHRGRPKGKTKAKRAG